MKAIFHKLKNKKGFTLVESVTSIAILSIATMLFAIFLANTTQMTKLTLQNEHDYEILQGAISQINEVGQITYEGVSITVKNEENQTFQIELDEKTKIDVNGKYIVVTNDSTGQSFKIFVGDKKGKA